MNVVILIGRLTKDPDVRHGNTDVARYTLAVDRQGEDADYISCVTFGHGAEFAEKYLHKGTKIAVTGRIQTGSYKNKEGKTVYTTDVIVNRHEFCERRSEGTAPATSEPKPSEDDFINIPEGIDEELPFT